MARKSVKTREPSARLPGTPPKPWEMQEGETAEQFRKFCFYRDMQKRSLQTCANAFGLKNKKSTELLCRKFNWVDRCSAWDVELDRRVRDSQVAEIADMRKRHINLGVGMQTAVVKELKALVAKIDEAATQAEKEGKKYHEPVLSVNELIKLSQHGTQIERLSRGEHTDHTKVDSPEQDLSSLSVKDLKTLKRLKEKVGAL